MKISKHRLESFSDGVIAIIVTIMVLNIPLPTTFNFMAVMELLNSIYIYFVTFFVVGLQWNKHRHIFDNIEKISNKTILINLLYLFFISLMPILTKWIIQNPDEVIPAIGYDIIFMLVTLSYKFLWNSIIKEKEQFKKHIEELKNEDKFLWMRFVTMITIIILVFLLSFYYPRISLIFFIGIPVVFSLINLIFENPRHHS